MRKKLKVLNYFNLAAIFGFSYILIEVIFGAFKGDTSSAIGIPYWSLVGRSSLWMFPVGAACGILLGLFNEINFIRRNCNVFLQAVLGAILVLVIELISGLILNVVFKLNIWDYSGYAFNIYGQVCLYFGFAWFLLAPFAFWFDDLLRYKFYNIGNSYSLLRVYKNLLIFWKKTNFQSRY